jgi:hypothetical protein
MADVASTLAGWSSTTASNTPADTTTIGSGLAGNLREIQGVMVRGLSHKGSDIASAATTDLGGTEGLAHDITGTTTITSFGTGRAGLLKLLQFDGALTLTHNASSLILPGGANITTAAGDVAVMFSEGSGNWRCYAYFKTASVPLAFTTQAIQETGTSNVVAVTPGRQHFHQSAAKAWVKCDFAGAAQAEYNITSITDGGTGIVTVTLDTDFSGADYVVVASVFEGSATQRAVAMIDTQAAGSVVLNIRDTDNGALVDGANLFVAFFGDL